ncbi:MAG: hypothetical protein ABEH60_06445 [Halonotius sp.]
MDDSQSSTTVTGMGGDSDGNNTDAWSRHYKLLAYCVASGLLFAIGLTVTELIGEVAVDVDFKPFVIPYILITINRFGLSTMSIGLGAALGEGVLDVLEGYEIDDPIGFLGYFLGFTTFGWYLHEVADDPTRLRSLTIGATLGAFVQACFEASAFLIFASNAGPLNAIISTLGNTITHGILLGAIPLVVVIRTFPAFAERIPPTET